MATCFFNKQEVILTTPQANYNYVPEMTTILAAAQYNSTNLKSLPKPLKCCLLSPSSSCMIFTLAHYSLAMPVLQVFKNMQPQDLCTSSFLSLMLFLLYFTYIMSQLQSPFMKTPSLTMHRISYLCTVCFRHNSHCKQKSFICSSDYLCFSMTLLIRI